MRSPCITYFNTDTNLISCSSHPLYHNERFDLSYSVESSPLRSFHRLCGTVAYTVQSACLAKSWGRVNRTTTTSGTDTSSSSSAASSSSHDGNPSIAPRCGVLSKETETKEVAFLSQLLFGLMLSVHQQMEQGQLEQLYAGIKKSNNQVCITTARVVEAG